MKKLISIILVLSLFASLAACGSESAKPKTEDPIPAKETEMPVEKAEAQQPENSPEPEAAEEESKDEPKSEDYYYGTWKVAGFTDGKNTVSVEDMIKNNIADESARDAGFILRENGEVYSMNAIYEWRTTDRGIILSDSELLLAGEYLVGVYEKDKTYIVFGKVSDDTEFPEIVEESGETEDSELKGIRPEFKAAMDSIEEFYDEYIEFMTKYMKNPTDLSLLMKYADMLTKVEEMEKKLDAWKSEDMSSEELQYYIEVTARIEKKLVGFF